MAIVKMTKFNLIAFKSQKLKLLKNLQKFKEVDFIDIVLEEKTNLTKVENLEELTRVDERITSVKNAIDLLRKYNAVDKSLKAMIKGNDNYTYEELSKKVILEYDWKKICEELRILSNKYLEIKTQITKRYNEIDELSIWNKLDVNPQELKKLKKVTSYLGTIPIKLKNNFTESISKLSYTYYEELKITKDEIYYLILSHNSAEENEKILEILRANSFSLNNLELNEVPKERIEILKEEISELKAEKRVIKEEIKVYKNEVKDLEAVYDYLINRKLRIETIEKLVQTDKVFGIEGWIPTIKVKEFEEKIKEIVGEDYYLEMEEAERDDETVPIKLKNGVLASAFESLTAMYAYPKYNEVDPTPFIAPFYIIFFGMMGADAGYGAVLLLATWFILKFANLNKKTKLFVQFFFYLSFSVIIWGILYGSYFGLSIPGLWKMIDPATEYNKLLIGSVLFGIVHIYFGLGLKAYLLLKAKKPLDAIYDVLFWYMALSGGILYLTLKILGLGVTVATISGIVSVIGMIGIVLTGGRDAKSFGAKFGGGLYSLYGISSYVGDFVSYSRLMALGLSGGFIAQAINMIIGMISGSWIGLMFVPFIFIGGHFFNMFLTFLGGYVHTSRLMYVEFFGKFYEGGGRPFKDFREESKYINLED